MSVLAAVLLDPGPAYPFTIAAGGTYELTNTYGTPGSRCQPTSLRMSVNVSVNGVVGTVGTASATLRFAPACTGNGIAVDLFSFSPAAVEPTANSALTLVRHRHAARLPLPEPGRVRIRDGSGCPVHDGSRVRRPDRQLPGHRAARDCGRL
ncbi:hypothetical protein ABH935_002695 [Catenulispora sp. GAS73]|uniref:hypothetical protein n=1 Tax=Catenulispora sp. GAS73 TaxID=3156269 RepID=UPI00351328A4